MVDFIWIKKYSLFLTTSFLAVLFSDSSQAADVNQVIGWSCSATENATLDADSQTTLITLLTSLAETAPKSNGFAQHDVASRKGDHHHNNNNNNKRLYGLAQCRGDVSPSDCGHCLRNATWTSANRCGPGGREGMVWLRWCMVRYSHVSFFGTWDRAGIAEVNKTTPFEEPSVVPLGVELMNGLVDTTPERRLMFETKVVEIVGSEGRPGEKRYGMAQCTRDVDAGGCRECLAAQLAAFRTRIGNRRGWEIYGSSCSLWYHDYRFYFDHSITASEGGRRYSANWFRTAMILFTVTGALLPL